MVVAAFNVVNADIFILDFIQNYGKLQSAHWTEITVANCLFLNACAYGAYEFLCKSGILYLLCRQTLLAYTLEAGVGSLVKKTLKTYPTLKKNYIVLEEKNNWTVKSIYCY